MYFEYLPELHYRWAYPASLGVMAAVVIGGTRSTDAWSAAFDSLRMTPASHPLFALHTCGHFAALWRTDRSWSLSSNRTPLALGRSGPGRLAAVKPGRRRL